MGKFKVSFTTALFVFSFLVCVIVAVVFVDRSPVNDYDSFYDKDAAAQKNAEPGKGGDQARGGWDTSANAAKSQPQATAAPAAPPEASLTDLPVDINLAAMAPPAPEASVAPGAAATPNPMQGRSPEQIARALMHKSGVMATAQVDAIPGMAVPEGIGTPAVAQQQPAATANPPASRPAFLPLQSNVQGSAPGVMPNSSSGYRGPVARGAMGTSSNVTNSSAWSPVAPQATQSNLIGIHKLPAAAQQGVMIGKGRVENNAAAPAGFSDSPINDGSESLAPFSPGAAAPGASPATALPGSPEKPLLLPPQSDAGGNKWELPPAPTLRPPPIQDPDRRRSDADDKTPDSLSSEETSNQALLISAPAGSEDGVADGPGAASSADETSSDSATAATASVPAAPAPDAVAQVRDHVLTKDQALRMVRAQYELDDKKLAKKDEEKEIEKFAAQWKDTAALAAKARHKGLSVTAPEMERYAAMRPDFEPAAWQMAMEAQGFSGGEIRSQLEEIALAEKLVDEDFAETHKTEDLEKAFKKEPSRYSAPRTLHVSEIFKARPADDDRAEKVKKEMKRLQRQAAGGTDFGLLARQTSEAPSKKIGGNLGWIDPEKDKNKERTKAITELAKGDVSDVVEDDDGFHIYKITDIREAAKDFESAKRVVVAALKEPVRKSAIEDARSKLESGELDPPAAPGIATSGAPSALAVASPTAVVPTTTRSSLGPLNAAAISQADAAAKAPQAKPATNSKPASQQITAADQKLQKLEQPVVAENKKFRAQELLGEMAAKRHAEEKGEAVVANNEMPAPETMSLPAAGGQNTQLLYAPGSLNSASTGQQQSAGSSAMPNAPVQSAMTAPGQHRINYGAQNRQSVNPGAELASGSSAQFALQAIESAAGMAPPSAGTGALQNSGQSPAAGPSGQRSGPANPRRSAANQSQFESNGWNVTQTTSQAGAAAGAGQPQQAQQQDASVPPGFEQSTDHPQQQRRGIVGSVKSFFSKIGH